MKSLQDLDIFVRTVDSGSLSATARALDLTPAAASAALKRLEAELGVALFVRSTRSLRLTQEGALFPLRHLHVSSTPVLSSSPLKASTVQASPRTSRAWPRRSAPKAARLP